MATRYTRQLHRQQTLPPLFPPLAPQQTLPPHLPPLLPQPQPAPLPAPQPQMGKPARTSQASTSKTVQLVPALGLQRCRLVAVTTATTRAPRPLPLVDGT